MPRSSSLVPLERKRGERTERAGKINLANALIYERSLCQCGEASRLPDRQVASLAPINNANVSQ